MADEKRMNAMPHNLVLEDRRMLTVSGVSDVDSFDEETVIRRTNLALTKEIKTTFIDECF